MSLRPFHLAFPVHDLAAARAFYGETMGCREGRSSAEWVDFDFYGHQIVAHLAPGEAGDRANNHVDGHGVPVPHFGVVLAMADWQALADRLEAAGTEFAIPCRPSASRGSPRTGHDVLPRPQRQRAGDEGLRRRRDAVCDVRDPKPTTIQRSRVSLQFSDRIFRLFDPAEDEEEGVKNARQTLRTRAVSFPFR